MIHVTVREAAKRWRIQRNERGFLVWRIRPDDEPQLRFSCSQLEYALCFIDGAEGV